MGWWVVPTPQPQKQKTVKVFLDSGGLKLKTFGINCNDACPSNPTGFRRCKVHLRVALFDYTPTSKSVFLNFEDTLRAFAEAQEILLLPFESRLVDTINSGKIRKWLRQLAPRRPYEFCKQWRMSMTSLLSVRSWLLTRGRKRTCRKNWLKIRGIETMKHSSINACKFIK